MGTVTESRDGGEGATTLGPFDDELSDEQARSPTPKRETAKKAHKRRRVVIQFTFNGSTKELITAEPLMLSPRQSNDRHRRSELPQLWRRSSLLR